MFNVKSKPITTVGLASRNRFRYRSAHLRRRYITSARVWLAAKNLSHIGHTQDVTVSVSDDVAFCSMLAMFFTNKVNRIKTAIALALAGRVFNPFASDPQHQGPLLSEFAAVSAAEVVRLIRSMPSKSSPLDVVPTSLLKACSGTFGHIIAQLANLSFRHAVFRPNIKRRQ